MQPPVFNFLCHGHHMSFSYVILYVWLTIDIYSSKRFKPISSCIKKLSETRATLFLSESLVICSSRIKLGLLNGKPNIS